jgi:hypothetical protein
MKRKELSLKLPPSQCTPQKHQTFLTNNKSLSKLILLTEQATSPRQQEIRTKNNSVVIQEPRKMLDP